MKNNTKKSAAASRNREDNMLYHYQTIPGAEKRIHGLMKKIGFVPDKNIPDISDWIVRSRRFYMPSGLMPGHRFAFLKARLQNTDQIVETLKKEMFFYKTIVPIISSSDSFLLPRYISNGNANGLFWLLREYIPGKLAGQMDEDFGFTRQFLSAVPAAKMAKNILTLQAATPKITKRMALDKHGSYWYIDIDHGFYKNTCLKKTHPKEIREIGRILRSNKKILDSEAVVAEHGDLYPNNFLFLKNNACLLDWELIHLNNCGFAPAFVYLNAWRSPKWQKSFLRSFARQTPNPSFRQLFRLCIFSLSLRLMRYEYVVQEYYHQGKIIDKNVTVNEAFRTREPKAAIAALKRHNQILQAALKNPEKLF